MVSQPSSGASSCGSRKCKKKCCSHFNKFFKTIIDSALSQESIMHQSFTTNPLGVGESRYICICSAPPVCMCMRVCGGGWGTLMIIALPKAPLICMQENAKSHDQLKPGINPAIPPHCGDNADVRTLYLSPAMPLLTQSRGGGISDVWFITVCFIANKTDGGPVTSLCMCTSLKHKQHDCKQCRPFRSSRQLFFDAKMNIYKGCGFQV